MTCHDCMDTVGELVDGTAHPDIAAAVLRHLDSCASCRALFEDLSRIRTAAAGLGPIEPAPHVWTAIQARLHPPDAWGQEAWNGRRALAAAAGFVLVASSLGFVASRLALPGTVATVAEA
ncbi:MAG TPA: zf-HC2 domain-containing protein, partial [Vicinamibacterales bacterium]